MRVRNGVAEPGANQNLQFDVHTSIRNLNLEIQLFKVFFKVLKKTALVTCLNKLYCVKFL